MALGGTYGMNKEYRKTKTMQKEITNSEKLCKIHFFWRFVFATLPPITTLHVLCSPHWKCRWKIHFERTMNIIYILNIIYDKSWKILIKKVPKQILFNFLTLHLVHFPYTFHNTELLHRNENMKSTKIIEKWNLLIKKTENFCNKTE